MGKPHLNANKHYELRLKNYVLNFTLKLTLRQVVCVATCVFFYAVLVIWPSQDEVLEFNEEDLRDEFKNIRIKRIRIKGEEPNPEATCVGITYSENRTKALNKIAKSVIKGTKKPVIVWWTGDLPKTGDTDCPSAVNCKVVNSQVKIDHGAYLFYASRINFTKLPLPRTSDAIIWGMLHEESPRNIPELMFDKGLNLFNFSSTYSRYSDVPVTLLHFGSAGRITNKAYYFVETRRKNFYITKGLAPVLYIQTDCDTSTERDDYVRELMKHIDIDSYGNCLNNKKLPYFKFGKDYLNHMDNDDFLKFISRYKFTIAIENGVCNDYITEKLWRPIRVGSVPIYFGSPTIRDWLPNNKSAILLDDYRTPKALSEYLKKLLAEDELYEEYLEHKTKGIITNQRIINELKLRPYQTSYFNIRKEFECFICEKLYNTKIYTDANTVNKKHYDCPKPISALFRKVNPLNRWVRDWESVKRKADQIYDLVFSGYL